MSQAHELQHFSECDKKIVEIVKDIRLLSSMSWASAEQERFLTHWDKGQPVLPQPQYQKFQMQGKLSQLEAISNQLDDQHPIGKYLLETTRAYAQACLLLENLGSNTVTTLSISMYGKPGDILVGSQVNNIEAAKHFIEVTREYDKAYSLHEAEYCLSAQTMQAELSSRINAFFHSHKINVTIDDKLVSKAAAGATRIRLRGGASYSEYDLAQLLEHEAFVHTLTAVNGFEQKNIRCFTLGAPRTTATQEGLATFSELVTGSIDISRMERIALRIIAIDMALKGADFIDVFKFFIDAEQTKVESFNSTMRVFRGVPVTGGQAFTKDTVYLHGLMSVHTFFRWALKHQKLTLCRYLFAGRMTINDVIALEPFFESGYLASPFYIPPWLQKSNGLAAYLAFSIFANRIHIDALSEDHDFESNGNFAL